MLCLNLNVPFFFLRLACCSFAFFLACSSTTQAAPWPVDAFPHQTWLSPLPLPGNARKRAFAKLRRQSLKRYLRYVNVRLRRLSSKRRASLRLKLAHQLVGIGAYEEALRVAKKNLRGTSTGIQRRTRLMAARLLLQERRPKDACRWIGAVEETKLWTNRKQALRALLLRAECSRQSLKFAQAEKALLKALPFASLVGDWVRLRLLESWQLGGKARKAIRGGVGFLRRFPRHHLANHVRFVVAQSLESAGRPKRALVWFKRLRTRFGARGRLLRKVLLSEAGLLRRQKQKKKAEVLLLRLLRSTPGTGEAQKALKWLRPLPQNPSMWRAVARHERRRGRPRKAAQLLDKALKHRSSRKVSWRKSAMAQVGIDWFRAKQYPETEAAIARFLKAYPDDRRAPRLRLVSIRAQFRRKRSAASVKAYEAFWKRYRRSSLGRMSLWWAAQLWSERKGGEARGIALFLRYAKLYSRSRRGQLALLKVGLVHYKSGRYKRALRQFQALSRRRGRLATRALFWMGKCYQKLKKTKKMRKVWSRVRFAGDPYYHARVRALLQNRTLVRPGSRLLRLLPDSAEEKSIRKSLRSWARRHWNVRLDQVMTRLQKERGFRRFRWLILAGWKKEALQVMQQWERQSSMRWIRSLVAARLWLLVGEPRQAIRSQGRWRRRLGRAKRRGLPSRLWWRLRFPIPFPMLYQRYAKESGVPALLMMSITRQESLFDPSARSRAGALGIAQMMPKEGRKMAKKMKLRDFKIDDLFRVSLNLRMGFLHFKEYLKRFKNNVPLTLVAYNAGPNALKRWIKEWGKAPEADLDAFVEIAVGYRETRRYAPACQRWYSTYRHVFAGKK